MAATQSGTVPLELYKHISLILNEYLGKECTHIQITKTLDPNGGVIGEFQNDSIIYGAISPVSSDTIRESIGTIKVGDLTAYFLSEEGVMVGTQSGEAEARYDLILYQDRYYSVENKKATAFDGGVAVVDKFILRRVPEDES